MTAPWMWPDATWLLASAWLTVGAGVAAWLASRGHAQEVALAALVAWPFLLPSLAAGRVAGPRRGPQGRRIDRVVDGVLAALGEAGGQTDASVVDLEALREALHAADGRIAGVEQVLADEPEADHDLVRVARAELMAARDGSSAELEGVLAGLLQLRLQVGRLTLAGDPAEVRSRLLELRARVGALGEVAQLSPQPTGTR